MKRFTIVQNGYNVEEGNRFIDIVIKRLEKLNNDNSLLQVKISSLEEQLKEKKVEEVKLSEAIIAAQQTKNNANSIVHEALLNAEKTEHEAMLLKKNITVYKNRVKNIIKSQLEIAEDLDKYDLDN